MKEDYCITGGGGARQSRGRRRFEIDRGERGRDEKGRPIPRGIAIECNANGAVRRGEGARTEFLVPYSDNSSILGQTSRKTV